MKTPYALSRQILILLLGLAALSFTSTTWSDSGKTPTLKKATGNNVSIVEDDNKTPGPDKPGREAKDTKPVKNKALKKAGTAAAAGAAGMKVKSIIQD